MHWTCSPKERTTKKNLKSVFPKGGQEAPWDPKADGHQETPSDPEEISHIQEFKNHPLLFCFVKTTGSKRDTMLH